jgi:NitT/TauT family transport system substrate-binding protein
MTMHRRTFARALVLAGAAPLVPRALAAQGTATAVRLGVGPVDDAAPLFYAAKTGLFKKNGLDVEVVKLANGAAILAAMAGGSIQLGQGSVLALVQAYSKGLPFTVIGNLATFDTARPNFGMLALNGSPIKTAKDLQGRTIGVVALQDALSLATYAWLDANGVDRASVKFVELPASATLAAMEQGRVDVSTFYEPFFSSYLATGKVHVIADPFEALGKHFSTAVLYATTTWAAANRETVDRFVRATQEASVYTAAHERDVSAVTAEYTGVDPARVTTMRHGGRGTILGTGDLQPIIDAAAKYQMIARAFPATDLMCECAPRR